MAHELQKIYDEDKNTVGECTNLGNALRFIRGRKKWPRKCPKRPQLSPFKSQNTSEAS